MKFKVFLIAVTLIAILFGGGALLADFFNISYLHGVYCALALGTTDGCDVNSPSDSGRLIEILVILVSIPAMGYVFSRVTGAHVGNKIGTKLEEHRDEMKKLINGDKHVD